MDISTVSNRIIAIKILVQGTVVSVISVYAPHCDKDNSKKIVIAQDFSNHVESIAEDFGDQHIKKGKGFWSFIQL